MRLVIQTFVADCRIGKMRHINTCVRLSRRTMTLCCSFCADCMRICAIASGFSFVNRLAFCLFVPLGDRLGDECTVFIMIKISVGFRESNPASMILH